MDTFDMGELREELLKALGGMTDEKILESPDPFIVEGNHLKLEFFFLDADVSPTEILHQLISVRMDLLEKFFLAPGLKHALHASFDIVLWLESRGVVALPRAKGFFNNIRMLWMIFWGAYA